jgi:hypothetical protein
VDLSVSHVQVVFHYLDDTLLFDVLEAFRCEVITDLSGVVEVAIFLVQLVDLLGDFERLALLLMLLSQGLS